MSEKLIVKHWQGFITSEGMETPGWHELWQGAALRAEKNGETLAVFRIPKRKPLNMLIDGEAVAYFERYLQGLEEGPPPGG